MIAINHLWTDNQLELAFSFSIFPCKVQQGADDFVVTFTPRTQEEAQIIKEQMVKTISELNKLTGGNNGMAT
jgi:phage gp37-like protein